MERTLHVKMHLSGHLRLQHHQLGMLSMMCKDSSMGPAYESARTATYLSSLGACKHDCGSPGQRCSADQT